VKAPIRAPFLELVSGGAADAQVYEGEKDRIRFASLILGIASYSAPATVGILQAVGLGVAAEAGKHIYHGVTGLISRAFGGGQATTSSPQIVQPPVIMFAPNLQMVPNAQNCSNLVTSPVMAVKPMTPNDDAEYLARIIAERMPHDKKRRLMMKTRNRLLMRMMLTAMMDSEDDCLFGCDDIGTERAYGLLYRTLAKRSVVSVSAHPLPARSPKSSIGHVPSKLLIGSPLDIKDQASFATSGSVKSSAFVTPTVIKGG